MKILIKKVKIFDKNSLFHRQIKDISIVDGIISEIANEINSSDCDEVFEANNYNISVGWIDFSVHFKDPGYEWLENLETLQKAACKGGVTELVGFPNTTPVVQTKEGIAYFKNFAKSNLLNLHNFAAVTKNCEGKDFTDMIDLSKNGAVGFSDGKFAIENPDILLKTLQYLAPLKSILIQKAEDKYLSLFGQINEGKTSTILGLKGIPSTAEELMIMRDLKLLEYANIQSEDSILHFSTISSNESVELIRKAKKKGLPVSCDIAAHQLAFLDEDLVEFDTNLKVKPPFRTQKDKNALIAGLKDGTIDFIVSDHNPLDEELKNLEFDMAEFGIIGLQTLFSCINTHSNLEIEQIVEMLTSKPRNLLKMANSRIEVGEKANLTLFDSDVDYVFDESEIVSLSKNCPFVGKKLKGKAVAVFNNNQFAKS